MNSAIRLIVDIKSQTLYVMQAQEEVGRYLISTAKKGAGERENSFQTPRGRHHIVEKIGHDLPERAVLVSRQFTGEIYDADLAKKFPERDWVLTRILWLSGLQPGFNQGGEVDSYERFIYFHGCPDSKPMGIPDSKGCIRMRNNEVIELFDKVSVGTEVILVEDRESVETKPVLRELNAQEVKLINKDDYLSLPRYTTDSSIKSEQVYHYMMWDQWGEVLAFCRLRQEGVVDGLHLQDPQWLKPLLSAVIARATAFCWFTLRVIAATEHLTTFTDLGFQISGDEFVAEGRSYRPCRLFLPHARQDK